MAVPKIQLPASAACIRFDEDSELICGRDTRQARVVTAFAGLEDSFNYPDLRYAAPLCEEHAEEHDSELRWMYS